MEPPPAEWGEVSEVSSGDTNSNIFAKLTSMVRNVRWLYSKLGTSDFSVSGDTVTGALGSLQGELSGKSPASHTHTVSELPVTNDAQANATTLIPSSAAVYSLRTLMDNLSSEIAELEEITSIIGTTWLYEEDGTFEVPVTGTYHVEIHGGGGGSSSYTSSSSTRMLGGGGSGEEYTMEYTKGQVIPITIGAGGRGSYYQYATSGGDTTFGDIVVSGGSKGSSIFGTGGKASGSLASAGEAIKIKIGEASYAYGGKGNINNPTQTYGNGGSSYYDGNTGIIDPTNENGQPGAVIITFIRQTN